MFSEFYEDKEHTANGRKWNYTPEYKNYKGWCQNCIFFGQVPNNPYWTCSEDCPDFARVSYCGHCDKFSSDEKIGRLKYWWLKLKGFKFENKVR